MASVRMVVRAALRRGWLGVGVLALLIGIAGGAVLAAVAGAQRTDSAFPRLLTDTHAADVQVVPTFDVLAVDPAEVARLPQVARTGTLDGIIVLRRRPSGQLDFAAGPGDTARASADGVLFYDLDRPRVLQGRMPRPDRPREVAISGAVAERLDLAVGDVFPAVVVDLSGVIALEHRSGRSLTAAERAAFQTPIDLDIVGEVRSTAEIVPSADQGATQMYLTPAFDRRFRDRVIGRQVFVKLRDPVHGLGAFEAELLRRHPNAGIQFVTRIGKTDTVAGAVGPYSTALQIFAVVAGLTAILVLGQAISRQVVADASAGSMLRALGMTRAHRASVAVARAVLCGLLGAALAVVVAVALSPLFPFGPAGRAEPDPGLHADWPTLGIGFAVITFLALARSVLTARRVTRRATPPPARSRQPAAVALLARADALPTARVGVAFALRPGPGPGFQGIGATAVGVVAAVAVAVGALGFGASFDRVASTPRLYGWTFDMIIEDYDGGVSRVADAVAADRELTDQVTATRGTVTIGERTLFALGLTPAAGQREFTLTEGRFPRGAGEVAFGVQTLRDLDRSVGDTIRVNVPNGPTQLEIVGRVVLPALTFGQSVGLGEGAAFTRGGLRALDPGSSSIILANIATGDITRGTERVRQRYGEDAGVLSPKRPIAIVGYQDVRETPLVLAVLLGFLGMGILAHALVSSTRRRARDLAVLRTFGFTRRQVWGAVAWQATTLVALALPVALVLGVVLGRWAWKLFADGLGLVSEPVVPVLAVAITAALALLVANLVAVVPARAAARTRPATVLRSE